MFAGVGVACFGQLRQSAQADILNHEIFAYATRHFGFQPCILVF